MADTIQIVRWALEQTCPLRPQPDAAAPDAALRVTNRARSFAENLRTPSHGFGVFGDVCVTSYTHGTDPENPRGLGPDYPASGFLLSKEFGNMGGPQGLFDTCSRCPANARPNDPAQCCGTLFQRPDSQETELQLQQIIGRHQLADEVRALFPPTTPLWYGFWIQSPLSPAAASVLGRILEIMAEEDEREAAEPNSSMQRHLRELRLFAHAATLASEKGLALHVNLAPPGHTDLGFYTTFPHCPRCRAEARLPRWQRKYSSQLQECRTCGARFSPAETASSIRWDFDWPELRKTLGQERFEAFAVEYLIARGSSPEKAARIVAATETEERERTARHEERRRASEAERDRIRAVIHPGLDIHWIQEDGNEEPTPAFTASDFEQLLRRAEEAGIKVTAIWHRSATGETDRYEVKKLAKPLEVLARWRKEGCDHLFMASFRWPK